MSRRPPKSSLADSGFFVLRAPLLPLTELPRDRDQLRALFEQPKICEALYVASPGFSEQFESWRREPGTDARRKIEHALCRYAARMCGRATPFGLFAGCSIGRMGRETRLRIDGDACRHTRLDMDYVVALVRALDHDPALRASLRFTPNTSLYVAGGRARYIEIRPTEKGWSHHRVSLELLDYLDVVLAGARDGATIDQLAQALIRHDPEAAHAEAETYVNELIDQQVLVSELAPAVTGPEPIHELIERLAALPAGEEHARKLKRVRDRLAAIDAEPIHKSDRSCREITNLLAELPASVDESRRIQADLFRWNSQSTLGDNVIAEIVRGVALLNRLRTSEKTDPLAEFRQAFRARYGDTPVTREVPLAEALDNDIGVGFLRPGEVVEASSLLEDVILSERQDARVTWGQRERFLYARLTEALVDGSSEIALTDRDLRELEVEAPPPLPDALAAFARIEADSDEAIARGEFRLFLGSAVGPSGARLLGRFCHADSALAALVETHLREEEALRPDAIFAEIVHLPEGRLGNILARPAWRRYEIPYLGRSSLPRAQQILISDLRVSLEGERIVLRSVRLGREVVPRLTSAHNFMSGEGIYRFLCALQNQGIAGGLFWDWGPLEEAAFLPRVVHRRLVLARARWRVTAPELKQIRAAPLPEQPRHVQEWRQRRRLPRWVCLSESDNELPIDLENPLWVQTLINAVSGEGPAILTELFPAPDRLCTTASIGRYTHELVVPLISRPETTRSTPPDQDHTEPDFIAVVPGTSATHRRVFFPNSEWLSIKLYAGSIAVDELVRETIAPLAGELLRRQQIRRWFFVRYSDPHFHLRLRLSGDSRLLWTAVWPEVSAAIQPGVDRGQIWKIQLDTYEREIERYGGPTNIELCEELFCHDSEAAGMLIQSYDDDSRGDRRWRLTLMGMDRWLSDLGLDANERRDLTRASRDQFREQFRTDGQAGRQLGAKFRAECQSLDELLDAASEPTTDWEHAIAIFQQRSALSAPIIEALFSSEPPSKRKSALRQLAPNLLHMHVNRMIRSAHRRHEAILYEFLSRYYDSQICRRSSSAR